ncbi:MAG: DUF3196 family protein [Erysipelotrichaceae bacterium]|nr:DUF3196 family protein [Erysipelotrichaceae bacterium]
MNYYDELIEKIENLLKKEDYENAKSLIDDELKVAYVPRDVEEKLIQYQKIVKQNTLKNKFLSDEQIEEYLKLDENHQLLAVDELGRKNLRDYYDLCNRYLHSNGYRNAKVLLIDSLIRQEINKEYSYTDGETKVQFNPYRLKVIEETDGFKSAMNDLQEIYLKEPSMFLMSQDLLFKECMFALPRNLNEEEGNQLALKISRFIDNAFNADK